MDPLSALAFAMKVIDLAPAAIAAVAGAKDAFDWGAQQVRAMVAENRDPTEAEWAELNARTEALRAKLHSDTE